MMLHDRIAALRARIVKAKSARNAWRASGSQAKYVKAYCVAETLEQQLEQLRQESLRASRKNSARAASASRSTSVKPGD
ncbi:MAG: hypothetical protein WD775_11415 [Burkholderiales bacterium]